MTDGVELVVVDSADSAAHAAAALLVEAATPGRHLVLAGGTTPRPAYELAAASRRDWSGVTVWPSDERCVPADDEWSNARLLRTALVERADVAPTLEVVPTHLAPAEAAAVFDAALRGVAVDLALLGLGADGHTASLFPDASSLDVTDRLAVATEAGLAPWVDRVTLTVPALTAVRHAVFLAVGVDKAVAVQRAFAAEPTRATPASLVRGRERTTVILDEAAAGLVSSAR